MKFAVNVNPARIECFEKGLVENFELACSAFCALEKEEFDRSAREIEKKEFKIISANGFIPPEYAICKDGYDLDALKKYVGKAIERMSYFACPKIVFGSGKARALEEGYGIEKGKNQFFEFLETACEMTDKAGMKLVMEPLNSGETNFLTTVKEGYDVAMMSGAKNCGVLCDFYHFSLEKEPLEDLEYAKDRLWHIHIACPDNRVPPKEGDGTDYAPFFNKLKEIGYDSVVTLESKWRGAEEAANSIEYLKKFI